MRELPWRSCLFHIPSTSDPVGRQPSGNLRPSTSLTSIQPHPPIVWNLLEDRGPGRAIDVVHPGQPSRGESRGNGRVDLERPVKGARSHRACGESWDPLNIPNWELLFIEK